LLCVEATDKMDPVKRVTPTNRELKAQGVGNIVAGFLGGIPVTQVIVRSSANIQAGGKSKISAIAHGILLLIAVIVLPRVMNLIPLATLAAILLLVGYKLARPALFKKMFRAGKSQFIPFLVTVGGVVFIDLLMGIGIGLVAATAGLLIENFRLPFHVDDFPETRDNRFRIVLAQQVTFLNKASVLRTLSSLPDGSKVEIDGTGSAYVHPDVIEIIDDFLVSAESRDIQVLVKGLSEAGQGLPGPGTNITLEPNPEQV
ncbi:MAG: SulP family inorganic anion transporter, partial [Myxococcales bacterium]|nr:SulP family inorganic anion transporter [Myxococcales bacterium]